jgi:hypothetical protein
MKNLLFHTYLLLFGNVIFGQTENCDRNNEVILITERFGPSISTTYQSAVCTELVIGVLEHLVSLDKNDKSRIRIITTEQISVLMSNNSDVLKGVVFALTANGLGTSIDSLPQVKQGDFVQFWYKDSWGHCGIVKSIDLNNKQMELYSSFPSTNGYGIQLFDIPEYCYFVRLK